jgi:hypothetical protein
MKKKAEEILDWFTNMIKEIEDKLEEK